MLFIVNTTVDLYLRFSLRMRQSLVILDRVISGSRFASNSLFEGNWNYQLCNTQNSPLFFGLS